jgi:Swt1-like HEPN
VKSQDAVQLLHMRRALTLRDLVEIGSAAGIEGLVPDATEVEVVAEQETYLAQFDHVVRREALVMARHYQLFYCLENTLRELVESQLEDEYGEAWWEAHVPDQIRQSVAANKIREQDNGVTLRSSHPIDYTTFGELSEVIKSNWDIFGATFNSKRGLEKVMSSLNLLRGPVAHMSPLADDEVVRLDLAVRDFFRLMS